MRTKPVKVSFLSETQKATISKYAFGQGLEVHEFLLMAAENYIARNKQSATKQAMGERIYKERQARASAVQQNPNQGESEGISGPEIWSNTRKQWFRDYRKAYLAALSGAAARMAERIDSKEEVEALARKTDYVARYIGAEYAAKRDAE